MKFEFFFFQISYFSLEPNRRKTDRKRGFPWNQIFFWKTSFHTFRRNQTAPLSLAGVKYRSCHRLVQCWEDSHCLVVSQILGLLTKDDFRVQTISREIYFREFKLAATYRIFSVSSLWVPKLKLMSLLLLNKLDLRSNRSFINPNTSLGI